MSLIKQRVLALLRAFVKEENKDEERLNELIAHVGDEHRELYKEVIGRQLEYCKNDQAAKTTICKKCNTPVKTASDGLNELLPKLAVRVLDNIIILDKWIGIQPMTGPVGLVYTLGYVNEEKEGDTRRLSLQVLSNAIEARSKRLSAAWTVESSQDLKAQHGQDMEQEIIQALASEIASEIIAEQIHYMQASSREDGKLPVIELDGGKDPLLDELLGLKLSTIISKKANDIARKTRRGAGNFVIVSPIILSILQSTKDSHFVKSESGVVKGPLGYSHVGTLNETIQVYCNVFTDAITVGYKGGNGQTDVGHIYSPYVLLMSSGVVVNPVTFQPVMAMMTRDGNFQQENGGDYYSAFKVDLSFDD